MTRRPRTHDASAVADDNGAPDAPGAPTATFAVAAELAQDVAPQKVS